jgi:serine/threonine protein kinase
VPTKCEEFVRQTDLPQCIVAIKRFTLKGRRRYYLRDEFLRERENLVEISAWGHDHLLGMLASFETTGARFDTLNIVLPFAGGGNLYEFLRLEDDARWEQHGYPIATPGLDGCLADWRYAVYREAVGLVDALAALHEDKSGKYMIHCDIKPANVLIQKRTFKLADFGLSRFKDSEETSKTTWYLGTALYSPPEKESLMGRGRDVWALGCVLLEIAFMIRYAFQLEVLFVEPDITNIIDDFKRRREITSQNAGREKTAIYHKTMACVQENMRLFSEMRHGLRRMITVDGLIPVIKKMLEEDPTKRIRASDAFKLLEAHYLRLQEVPELQEEIEWQDNPGGPLIPEEENMILEAPISRMAATEMYHGPSPPMAGRYPRPSIRQAVGSSFGSTGATTQLHDLWLQDRKRSSSVEESSSNKRRWQG